MNHVQLTRLLGLLWHYLKKLLRIRMLRIVRRIRKLLLCCKLDPATGVSKLLTLKSLLKEIFWNWTRYNSRTNSLLSSILWMVTSSSRFRDLVPTDNGFDSFFQDLHAFRNWHPPEICKVDLYIIEKLKVSKEFRWTKFIAVTPVAGPIFGPLSWRIF